MFDDCCGTHPVNSERGNDDDRRYFLSNANNISDSDSILESDVRIMIGECILDGSGGCQRSEQYGSNCCSSSPQLNDVIEENQDSEADSCCGDCKAEDNAVKSNDCEDADSCCGRDDNKLDIGSCGGVGCCDYQADLEAESCCGDWKTEGSAVKSNDYGDADSCCGRDDGKLSLHNSIPDIDSCGGAGCCDGQADLQAELCCSNEKNEQCCKPKDPCCGNCDTEGIAAKSNDCGDADSCCGRDDSKLIIDSCEGTRCCGDQVDLQIESCCSDKKNGQCCKPKDSCCGNAPGTPEQPSIQVKPKPAKEDGCCGIATVIPEQPSTQAKPVEKTGCCSKKQPKSSKAFRKKRCCPDNSKSNGCRQAASLPASCCPEKKQVSTSCCTNPWNNGPQQYVIRRRRPHARTESLSSSDDTMIERKVRGKQPERHSTVPNNFYGRFFECCCAIGNKLVQEYNQKHGVQPQSSRAPAPGLRRSLDNKKRAIQSITFKEKSKVLLESNSHLDTLGFLPNDIDLVELGKIQGTQSIKMSVQGMDCPSCAPRVYSAFATIPSVSNAKVNTFTGFATYDCIVGAIDPEDIAKRVARMTGFGCEVVQEAKTQESSKILKVIVNSAPGSWDDADLPRGIAVRHDHALSLGNHELVIDFDASVIKPRQALAAFSRWGGILQPTSKAQGASQADKDVFKLLRRFCISAICCIPVLVFSWAPIPHHPVIYDSISLALTTVIQLYIAAPLYVSAFSALFYQGLVDMDLLVVLSTTVAYVFSVVAYGLNTAGIHFSDNFFETSALLVTLIILGRLISAYARRRTTSALDNVQALQVHTVDLMNKDGSVETIEAELMHEGDVLRVLPESRIPTDGVVTHGSSQVDESSITGEHLPVDKQKGSALTAGTINLSGMLIMSVTKLTTDNTIAEISRLMSEAQNARLPIQDLGDKAASCLAPVVLVISTITFIIWILVGLLVRHQSSTDAGIAALRYAIAVMVVSCPCAIAVCVPMIVVISVAAAAKEGVLFKSVAAVQYARLASVAVFDKTGTLTKGELSVMGSHLLHENAAALAVAITSNSRHPVSEAVASYLQEKYPDLVKIDISGVKSLAGKGMQANFGTKKLRGGNCGWLKVEDVPLVQNLRNQALTLFVVMLDRDMVAIFALSDSVRAGAEELVRTLEARGTTVYILSGDEQPTVSALASKLGIPQENAIGRCTPQAKQEKVKELQANGKNSVLFVGDGTNDSIALVQADVGVSMDSGTDIAVSAADVIITNSADIAQAIKAILKVSDGAYKRILVGFGWAAIYNLFAISLAAGAFVDIRIAPEYAGLGEMVSVLPMVIVAWSMWFLNA